MKKDFGVLLSSMTMDANFSFENILLDTVLITRLPDDAIAYTIFSSYTFNEISYVLSIDIPDETLFIELFHNFFKSNISKETLTRFWDLSATDVFDYVKFDEYNYRFNCNAVLGEPVTAEFETYIPFTMQSLF